MPKKQQDHFHVQLTQHGLVTHHDLRDDGDSAVLLLTIWGGGYLPPRPALIQLVSVRFNAYETDALIACLAKVLGYEIDSDIPVLTSEFEGECTRALINDNSIATVSVDLWNRRKHVRLSFHSLNFHFEDFIFHISLDVAGALLKKLGSLYGWKLED